MNTSTNLESTLLQQPFNTVSAIFTNDVCIKSVLSLSKQQLLQQMQQESGMRYTFKVEPTLNIQVGDFAIVHANGELNIVQICELHKTPQIDPKANYNYKWVIDKVRLSTFKQRMKEEARINELLADLYKVEQLHQLQNRLKQACKVDKDFLAKYKSGKNKNWFNAIYKTKHK
ncbi:MAG: hypothetical protein CSA42_05235 [Gammaproteobacteria bacterium]|nr:MAG: hypothetical protein CSA42_05235 [Gammaproteobacteria bacterium]